jgi:lysophospholipase L1-like esterase
VHLPQRLIRRADSGHSLCGKSKNNPGSTAAILMLGINDIGWPDSPLAPHEQAPSADDIIEGYKQLIARAHVHGMRIIGATLTPFEDAF